MTTQDNERIAHLWYEVMWSKPDPDIADEIIDPGCAPVWIQIDKKGPAQVRHEMKYFRSVFPATAKTIEYDGATILYIRDGKVIDQWSAFSFYDMLTDLGLVPPIWELKDHIHWSP